MTEIVRLAEQAFGHLPPSSPMTPEPGQFAGGERREIKALEQAHFNPRAGSAGLSLGRHLHRADLRDSTLAAACLRALFQGDPREARPVLHPIYSQVGS